MTPCPSPTRTALTRTGALALVFGTAFGLALGPAGVALAQDATAPSTVRVVLDGDGSVEKVDRVGTDEKAPSVDQLPVTLAIAETAEDGATRTEYTVQNTTTEKQTLSHLGRDGKPVTFEQDVALPLVAQLSVLLPPSRTNVEARDARITKLADGSTELVWSLVLFRPIGSPKNEVSFTSSGDGEAVTRLDVAAVQPNSTPGLSATGQALNTTVNGNGIYSTVSNGANEGLLKLSDGVSQLLAGLDKLYAGAQELNAGIAKGADGAEQLADGSEKAKAGSGQLSTGLAELYAGTGKLSTGAGALDAGAGKISDGLGAANAGGTKLADGSTALAAGATQLDTGAGAIQGGLQAASEGGVKLADGSAALATGAGQAEAGAKALSDGLALISGGLDQLSAAQGLPAALDGAKKLQVGVDQIRAGLGDPSTSGTVLNGVAQISGGLGLLSAPTGLPAAKQGVDSVRAGIEQKILPGLGDPTVPAQTVRYAVEAVRRGLAEGVAAGGGIDQLIGLVTLARAGIPDCVAGPPVPSPTTPCEGANTALFGLSHPVGALGAGDEGGLKQRSQTAEGALDGAGAGLTAIVKGLNNADPNTLGVVQGLALISGKPSTATTAATGLSKAIEGVQALKVGVDEGLTPGLNRIALGLESGDPTKPGIAEGIDALVAGLTAAVGGVDQLADGAETASTGSVQLAAGNSAIAAGAGQLAGGAGALSTGLSQLYTGSQELKAGTGKLAAGATQVAAGNTELSNGLNQLYTGSQELKAGTAALSSGSQQLNTGAGKAAAGSKELDAGLGKIADGQRQVADGLPAAVDGSGQIADGLGQVVEGQQKVAKGLGDVRTQAVEVLSSQFKQGTEQAQQQLAGLEAASAMIGTTPGAATTTYVYSTSADSLDVTLASTSSDLGRNLGLAAGGALLLMGGLAAGYVSGRRKTLV